MSCKKAAFHALKDGLLRCNSWSFAMPFAVFCKAAVEAAACR